LNKNDPTIGFSYDATTIAGHSFPNTIPQIDPAQFSVDSQFLEPKDDLVTRLTLGSHIAQYLRLSLEETQGYTSTVGISTNKLLSKLVGNLNKPKGQTTLLPPYVSLSKNSTSTLEESQTTTTSEPSNVFLFLDPHDVGRIPGIGFKISQKIRNHILSRPASFSKGLIYGGTKDPVLVSDVRNLPSMGPDLLEKLLGGPGAERGIGGKIWNLINGIDDSEVQRAKKVPSQISIEDSYIRLDTMSQVLKEMRILCTSLIKRMHTDLLNTNDDDVSQRWIAHPKTLRLSTRPRPPLSPDGSRTRNFSRISRSGPLPNFVFNTKESIDATVEKLITVALLPMFKRLHPQPRGWDLSLMNLAVTNMVESATEDPGGKGRDIARMFGRQEEVLKEWRVEDRDVPPDIIDSPTVHEVENIGAHQGTTTNSGELQSREIDESPPEGSEDMLNPTQNTIVSQDIWDDEDEETHQGNEVCGICGAMMPPFALAAHERFHALDE
jgi:DNA polymerase iota